MKCIRVPLVLQDLGKTSPKRICVNHVCDSKIVMWLDWFNGFSSLSRHNVHIHPYLGLRHHCFGLTHPCLGPRHSCLNKSIRKELIDTLWYDSHEIGKRRCVLSYVAHLKFNSSIKFVPYINGMRVFFGPLSRMRSLIFGSF